MGTQPEAAQPDERFAVEMIIRHTKEADEEIERQQHPEDLTSPHDLKEDGKGLKIVRQSLPYGAAMALTVCTSAPTARVCITFEQQLLSMLAIPMVSVMRCWFTKPVTGSYYSHVAGQVDGAVSITHSLIKGQAVTLLTGLLLLLL
ncbi:hypothetical protein ACLK19_16055 [Escherichia coli]